MVLLGVAIVFLAPGGGSNHEIAQIKHSSNLLEQVKFYKQLIRRVGPGQAQEDLYRSGLPFTGETHLLNHEVGDYLYEKYGVTGLSKCKEYFLASCGHGFIIHAIQHGGVPEVSRVLEACRPLGLPVFQQCAHAVGHGFLAFSGYKNLTQALKMCDKVQTTVSDFPLFNCHDGVFMENIWAVHEGGEPSPDRWIKDSDPVYPCDDPRINTKYLTACWSNQSSTMYRLFRGDIQKIGEQCGQLTQIDLLYMCYNGLSRQIHPIAAGSLDQTFKLCGQLSGTWVDYCISTNATASFSVGDRTLPFQICDRIDQNGKNQCYSGLVAQIGAYAKIREDRSSWCAKIKDQAWKDQCNLQN